MTRKYILATRNEGKLREFNHAFEGTDVKFVSLNDLPGSFDVEETGSTYEENALLKARAIARRFRRPAVADDSGIEIAAMPGELGVKSARYAGDRPYSEVNAEILERLNGASDRSARYVCVLAMVDPESSTETVITGTCEGVIHDRQKGSGGFGYDPVFYVPEYGKTMAQLPLEVKNRISHRARAIGKLKAILLPSGQKTA
ncbi:MAG: RdgB/HAM1 family non-canonical purine NTP pyrophosphatase [Candidatus Nitrospinota bacterium M3_3B_026]